ncbi:MAG: hypothetical protein IKA17_08550 [Clostridia bacterium]|nr:hypothetical protein [Clostridia bacterium]
MNTFNLVISSPEGEVFSGEVVKIILRGAIGDLAVMAGHIPFVTSVKEGECRVTFPEEEKTATIGGGMLSVTKEQVTLLSGSFNWN